jgi:hypothetical protein
MLLRNPQLLFLIHRPNEAPARNPNKTSQPHVPQA